MKNARLSRLHDTWKCLLNQISHWVLVVHTIGLAGFLLTSMRNQITDFISAWADISKMPGQRSEADITKPLSPPLNSFVFSSAGCHSQHCTQKHRVRGRWRCELQSDSYAAIDCLQKRNRRFNRPRQRNCSHFSCCYFSRVSVFGEAGRYLLAVCLDGSRPRSSEEPFWVRL